MKKRLIEPEILRGLAIIGVVLIHISSTVINTTAINTYSNFLGIFVNQVTRFAVPAFLIMSGWGLTISNKMKDGYFSFLKNQLFKIIWLYLGWNVIYYIMSSDNFNVINFIKGILLGTNYYHLYYVPITIIFYLLYPFLLKMGKTTIGLLCGLLISLISQTADSFINISALDTPQNIFNWVFYFIFGIWLANNYTFKIQIIYNKRFFFAILLIFSTIFIIVESIMKISIYGISISTTSMRPSIIIFSTLISILVLSGKINNKWLVELSNRSYGIYLSHPLILTIFSKVASVVGFTTNNLLYIFITFTIVMPISILFSKFIDNSFEIVIVRILQQKLKNSEYKM